MIEALRHYAAIAYVTIVVAVDRRGLALRAGQGGELNPSLIERLLTVELRLPPADPGCSPTSCSRAWPGSARGWGGRWTRSAPCSISITPTAGRRWR